MASSDPHTGGSLSEMAVSGTKMPNDAGSDAVLPSVARPDQQSGHPDFDSAGSGYADAASAADNASDIPRRNKDIGVTGDVITGTGDQLPAEVETKRLNLGANNPAAKGHDRSQKHAKQNQSNIDKYSSEGAEVEPAPGEEEESQDTIRERKGA